MKVVILAGGLGTRISEETHLKPKPMVEIGGMPILWHIMKYYSSFEINEFIICCGYKGYMIKEYFANYFLHMSNVTIDITNNKMEVHEKNVEPWKITLVDTGENTMTGGRLKAVEQYIKDEEDFCFTYGDGLSDINLKELIKFHKEKGVYATLTAVYPPARFGVIESDNDCLVNNFKEKPRSESGFINGGFFILKPKVLEYINNNNTVWEESPLETLTKENELAAFKHKGFWQPMDTLRDKHYLEKLWDSGTAPWKMW